MTARCVVCTFFFNSLDVLTSLDVVYRVIERFILGSAQIGCECAHLMEYFELVGPTNNVEIYILRFLYSTKCIPVLFQISAGS